jgi:DNA processing protein
VRSAPSLSIKQGAKLVTCADDVIEELPTPVRAVLCQRKLSNPNSVISLLVEGLTPTEQRIYALLGVEKPKHIDDLVETTRLNSSEVLATLFALERKGIVRQLP